MSQYQTYIYSFECIFHTESNMIWQLRFKILKKNLKKKEWKSQTKYVQITTSAQWGLSVAMSVHCLQGTSTSGF